MATTNVMSLPVELDGITADWLEAALSGYAPGVRVKGFEMVDFINTTCTKIRLSLDLEGNRTDAPIPKTVILKGGFEPHSRKMWPMHKNEALSYATLMPQLGLRVLKAYKASQAHKDRRERKGRRARKARLALLGRGVTEARKARRAIRARPGR